MIEYEQIPGDTMPLDVRITTDDNNAELAYLNDVFIDSEWEDAQTFANLQEAEKGEDGKCSFVIPGEEVGEVSELVWDMDNGKLERCMQQWNQEAIEKIESESDND